MYIENNYNFITFCCVFVLLLCFGCAAGASCYQCSCLASRPGRALKRFSRLYSSCLLVRNKVQVRVSISFYPYYIGLNSMNLRKLHSCVMTISTHYEGFLDGIRAVLEIKRLDIKIK